MLSSDWTVGSGVPLHRRNLSHIFWDLTCSLRSGEGVGVMEVIIVELIVVFSSYGLF